MTVSAPMLRPILENWDRFEWTVQGFGMVRTYLDEKKRWRLNIWDPRLAVPKVSIIHDHPWSFKSYVLCGVLTNTIYDVHEVPEWDSETVTHEYAHIVTGEGGGPTEKRGFARLDEQPHRIYAAGSEYSQPLDVVHKTSYLQGTVTLNDRTPPTQAHTARVFWPVGRKWVDAEPRLATNAEIGAAVISALKLIE